jgi:enoyl-CoA hydratase
MSVHYESDGPVAVVTIDRPDVANAIDHPTADALVAAFTSFDADDSLAVAVLTGGPRQILGGSRSQGDA